MVSLFYTLLTVHVVICALLGIVIVFQKTSGEGLLTATNKNPFMSGDEVASFLTKVTSFIVIAFFIIAIAIASVGSKASKNLSLTSPQQQASQQQ